MTDDIAARLRQTRRVLWERHYISLWSDGEIGVSDGVGYVGTICSKETRELYQALRKYYGHDDDDDIVARLRLTGGLDARLLCKAADEIERLREALKGETHEH